MYQILFRVPYFNIPVYGYGVMMVIGFFAAMWLAQFLAVRSKINPEIFGNAALIALVTGVLGARLSHVLENINVYTDPSRPAWSNFMDAINIRSGGLTYYGGFLLAFPSLILYGWWKKVSLRTGMDIVGPCLMVGLAFGRIGCFLNGCCYGAECKVAWAVQFPYGSDAYVEQFDQNALAQPIARQLVPDFIERPVKNAAGSVTTEKVANPLALYMDSHGLTSLQEPLPSGATSVLNFRYLKSREQAIADGQGTLVSQEKANAVHPAQLYSTVTAFLIAAFLLAYFTMPHIPGHVFAAMMMIEGLFRYILEMLRVEPAVMGRGTGILSGLPPQSYSMVVSVVLIIGGVVLWFAFSRFAARRGERRGLEVVPA